MRVLNVLSSQGRKTLGIFSLILLSSVNSAMAARVEYSGDLKVLNNFTQFDSVINSAFEKYNYRVKISLNDLNEKLNNTNCDSVQWQLPAGAQLRGRSAIVGRCRKGTEITQFYQPIDVRLHATIAVASRALRFNERVDSDAIRYEERDITQLPSQDLMEQAEDLIGQQARRAVAQGLSLRRDMFEPLPVIRAGDNIKVIIAGDGFRLTTEAIAMQAGQPGQQIRVKTAQGKVLTGAVSAQSVVELRL